MKNWQRFRVVLAIVVCVLVGAARISFADAPTSLIVSAASSLTNVMQALGKDFEQRHSGATVIFNFGSTGDLLAQMGQGAPVDIFVSASVAHMDQAQAKGLIVSSSRKIFAGNTLVLAIPASSTIAVAGLRDLASPQVERIGIGKPESVPVGRYGKEVLVDAGLWNAVEGKLIYGNSVRQVLDYLRRGEVDAALIYATDAKVAGEQVMVVTGLPGNPILYPVALVKTNKNYDQATAFLDYMTSGDAKAVLVDHGFLLPSTTTTDRGDGIGY